MIACLKLLSYFQLFDSVDFVLAAVGTIKCQNVNVYSNPPCSFSYSVWMLRSQLYLRLSTLYMARWVISSSAVLSYDTSPGVTGKINSACSFGCKIHWVFTQITACLLTPSQQLTCTMLTTQVFFAICIAKWWPRTFATLLQNQTDSLYVCSACLLHFRHTFFNQQTSYCTDFENKIMMGACQQGILKINVGFLQTSVIHYGFHVCRPSLSAD